MRFKLTLLALSLLAPNLHANKTPKYKRFECRISKESSYQKKGERNLRVNLTGVLHEKSTKDNLYILHNVSGNFVWDVYGEKPTEDLDPSNVFASGYMTSRPVIENKVNYKPRRYHNTIKFELPLGFGDFQLMMPYKAMQDGRVYFKSFMIGSWVSDHDGSSLSLDCVSYLPFTPLSDQYRVYTNDKSFGEEALKVRNDFRVAQKNLTQTKFFKGINNSSWTCDYYTKKYRTPVAYRNLELNISAEGEGYRRKYKLSGLFDGDLGRSFATVQVNTPKDPRPKTKSLNIRRTKVSNGKFDLLIEVLPKFDKYRHGRSSIIHSNGLYSITNPDEAVSAYAKCRLKS